MTTDIDGRDEFETPLMRDLSKLMPQVFVFLISFIVGFMLYAFPFSLTEYGSHCIVQTTGSVIQYVFDNIRGVC